MFGRFSEDKLLAIALGSRARTVGYLIDRANALDDDIQVSLTSTNIIASGLTESERTRWCHDRKKAFEHASTWIVLLTVIAAATSWAGWALWQSESTFGNIALALVFGLLLLTAAFASIPASVAISLWLRLSIKGHSEISAEIFEDLGRRVCLLGQKSDLPRNSPCRRRAMG